MTIDQKAQKAAAVAIAADMPLGLMDRAYAVAEKAITAYLSARPAPDHAGLVERLAYRVNNPSAWDTFDQGGSDLIAEAATALSAASPAPLEGVTVQLDEDAIMEVIRECFPWQSEGKILDLLVYEKSVPLFPQATYNVPNYRAEKFVRAIEARILSAIVGSAK